MVLFENNNNTFCLFSFFNPQFDHDPRQPAYIATQGPLAHTVADFWQVSVILPLIFHLLLPPMEVDAFALQWQIKTM